MAWPHDFCSDHICIAGSDLGARQPQDNAIPIVLSLLAAAREGSALGIATYCFWQSLCSGR